MAIQYPLSHPSTPGFKSIRVSMDDAINISTSPYTYTTQVQAHQGQRWIMEVSLPPMRGDTAAAWEAWLTALRGQYGTFLLGDSARKTPRGTGGTPSGASVDGANQTGMELVTKGWNTSELVLKAGDYIQIGCVNEFTSEFTSEFFGDTTARLHKVLQDVTTDSAGKATIQIWPRLRTSPGDSAGIVTSNCKGTFRLAENMRGWDTDEAKFYGISFKAVEAL